MAVRSGTGTVEDSTTQTERPPSSCDASNPPSVVTEMRMSVLLAQESDDIANAKSENATSPVPPSKRKTGRKHSREKQQQYGSKDSVKIVNEVGCPRNKEPVDPAETRSLLDEDKVEVEGVNGSNARTLSQGAHCIEPLDEPRAPQAEAEVDDEGDESQEIEDIPDADETSESLTGLMDSTVGMIGNSQLGDGDDISQTVTGSPILTPRKTGRRGHSAMSSDSCVAPPSPSGGAASTLSHQSESLSLPGTPLSNASAVSRSSDASVSSASSTRALLSHPTDGSPSSAV